MNWNGRILLITGVLVGFIVTYLIVRDRDMGPVVIRDARAPASTVSGTSLEDSMALIRELESDLSSRPDDFQLLLDLANLYFDIRSFETSVEYYERALEIRPNDPDLRTDLGTALYYSNQIDRAIAEFETSLKMEPDHPQTLFNMGVVVLEQRNDREGAIQLWERLLRANPDYPQRAMVQSEIDRLRNQP